MVGFPYRKLALEEIMGINSTPTENSNDTLKAVYVKPTIKQVRLVPGESVLGSCKLNNGLQNQCNLGEICFGYTPFS